MADTIMSTQDVLSILGQMDLDLTQHIAAKRGIARIREVMTAFEVSSRALVEQEAVKSSLQARIQSLQSEYESRLAEEKKAFAKAKDAITSELEDLKQKTVDARARMAELNTSMQEKESLVSTRSAQLESEIQAKTAALTKVTTAFEAFIKKHAITA